MTSREVFVDLDPTPLWANFSRIAEIPRPSGHESEVIGWIADWAATRGYPSRRDTAGNIAIYVPGSLNSPGSQTTALQAHLDMVCVRHADSRSDPMTGNIEVIRDGEWIVAPHCTLGADNGIGIAAAMCLAESNTTPHGPLELLFTVEEETTLKGADNLDPDLVHTQTMLNLDADVFGELTIGCAGGTWTILRWPAPTDPVPESWLIADIVLSGLTGGHSGVDILNNRLNAIKGIVWLIRALQAHIPFHLCRLEGGDAFNAIPVRSHATIAFPSAEASALDGYLARAQSHLAARFSATDPHLSVSKATVSSEGVKCWPDQSWDRLLHLLTTIPSGVVAMEQHAPDLVESSSNLGIVAMRGDALEVHSLSRSSVAAAQEEIVTSIASAANLAGSDFAIVPPVVPPWRVPPDSPLLGVVKASYRNLFQRDPKLVTVHAGNECATIQRRVPGLDVVSIGPDIHQAHMPGERVSVPSVVKFHALLCEVVYRLAT